MFSIKDLKDTINKFGLQETLLEVSPDEIKDEDLSKLWDNLFIGYNLLLDFWEKCDIL